jgi:hypothetical protein
MRLARLPPNGPVRAGSLRQIKALYEIRPIGAAYRIGSPQKSTPIGDFYGGRFCGSRSDLAEAVL